ncbi:diacylglycerol kinase family protein [Martelella sp. HB161492]|uniref:diacylglycerol/lipid kinase family protein n=1 Tax=Martelella sp. HB161492 TaxID=2720726 RepID=UPI001592AC6B|nr:diacylglycerol kinase family protein [Martelella sp. HB161492]
MRFLGIFNRDGGTFKTTDLKAFCDKAHAAFAAAGHEFACDPVSGSDVMHAIDDAATNAEFDGLVVGGGDGTISLAAARLSGTQKVLGVLPAGTMNLFARALGFASDLDQALGELADGVAASVDIPLADGRPFIHQFSAGLHAQMIHSRETMDYQSRLGKLSVSLRAWLDVLGDMPQFRLRYESDAGSGEGLFSHVGVTNNRIDRNALPYTDQPQGGRLGLYLIKALEADIVGRLAFDFVSGRVDESEAIIKLYPKEVTLHFESDLPDQALDGDPFGGISNVTIRQQPRALNVLVPRGSPLANG